MTDSLLQLMLREIKSSVLQYKNLSDTEEGEKQKIAQNLLSSYLVLIAGNIEN